MLFGKTGTKKQIGGIFGFNSLTAGLSAALIVAFMAFGASSRAISPETELEIVEIINNPLSPEALQARLVEHSKKYLGRSYRFRNSNGEAMDCSGFVRYIYSKLGIRLPRTATEIGRAGTRIDISEVQPGDLLFFKGSSLRSSAVGHVGMVTERVGDNVKMIHSSRRGVVIDDYPAMRYYRDRFLFATRVPQLQEIAWGDSIRNEEDPLLEIETSVLEVLPVPRNRFSIIGVGDLMLGTNHPNRSYLPPNDGRDLLSPVKHILQSGDLSFANLEGVLMTAAGRPKRCPDQNNCYAFKSPDHYAGHIREAGIELLSLANNHIGDFGEPGKENTVRVLQEAGFFFAGLRETPSTTFEKDGLRYGFCAFAPFAAAAPMNDYNLVRRTISELKSRSDIVIVSFHGGGEGSAFRHINRRREIYLNEDRGNPYEFARVAIDAGADIVFGHGPHVTRAVDLYKDRFIAYSLGNFATYGIFNLRGSNGVAPIVKVNVDRSGAFLDAQVYSIKQTGRGGPQVDESNRALQEMIRLTEADFPEGLLHISPTGFISRKS